MGDDAWTRVATADECAAMARMLDDAMRAGAWGLSTSFLDVDAARSTGAVARRRRATSSTRCFDVLGAPAAASSSSCPACSAPTPRSPSKTWPAAAARATSRSRGPGFAYSDSNPAATRRRGSTWRAGSHGEGIRFYPQLSPRTVDFRLNWDSSMMFMSMPEGWHRVVAARGADKAATAATTPRGAPTARDEWDRTEKAMFPHRRPETVRFVEVVGAENEPWLGRTPRRPRRRARRASVRRASPTSCWPTTAVPVSSRSGIANADIDGVARTFADPDVLDQLVRRRRPHADAVRVRRHHAGAHAPRARARRLHARSRRSTS